jgi:hypothetical protein
LLEREFEAWLIKQLKAEYPGCIILKNDSQYLQGVPDRLILFEDRWASLEVKQSRTAKKRPNQGYYIDRMNEMSFAAFVSPENAEEVLRDLQLTLRPRRAARLP